MIKSIKFSVLLFLVVLYGIIYWKERSNLYQLSFFLDSFNFILIYFSFTVLTRMRDLVFLISSFAIILSPVDLFENISANKLLYLLNVHLPINYNWFFIVVIGLTIFSLLITVYEALVVIFKR